MNGPRFWAQLLRGIENQAIIAGGAVRDWFMGLEPKDIDIFIHENNPDDPSTWHQFEWERDPEVILRDNDYPGIRERIIAVEDYIVQGMKINVIRINTDLSIEEYIDLWFDINICKAFYRADADVTRLGHIECLFDFLTDLENRTITISRHGINSPARADRIRQRFGAAEWTVVDPFEPGVNAFDFRL